MHNLGSLSFMNVLIEENKKIIAIYPIFIFYLFIGWFVLFIWFFVDCDCWEVNKMTFKFGKIKAECECVMVFDFVIFYLKFWTHFGLKELVLNSKNKLKIRNAAMKVRVITSSQVADQSHRNLEE
jgi:hypothetical protein